MAVMGIRVDYFFCPPVLVRDVFREVFRDVFRDGTGDQEIKRSFGLTS
jgi:hypothetical protein